MVDERRVSQGLTGVNIDGSGVVRCAPAMSCCNLGLGGSKHAKPVQKQTYQASGSKALEALVALKQSQGSYESHAKSS